MYEMCNVSVLISKYLLCARIKSKLIDKIIAAYGDVFVCAQAHTIKDMYFEALDLKLSSVS